MKYLVIIVFSILFVLVSCGSAEAIKFPPAEAGEFTVFVEADDLLEPVENALNFWNGVCPLFHLSDEPGDIVIGWGECSSDKAIGCATPGYRCDIRIREIDLNLVEHEIGHCLGLQHNSQRDSLMYPYVSEHYDLLPAEVDQVMRVCTQ